MIRPLIITRYALVPTRHMIFFFEARRCCLKYTITASHNIAAASSTTTTGTPPTSTAASTTTTTLAVSPSRSPEWATASFVGSCFLKLLFCLSGRGDRGGRFALFSRDGKKGGMVERRRGVGAIRFLMENLFLCPFCATVWMVLSRCCYHFWLPRLHARSVPQATTSPPYYLASLAVGLCVRLVSSPSPPHPLPEQFTLG